jgi:CxxC motif-containing protein (DUF1111 family)
MRAKSISFGISATVLAAAVGLSIEPVASQSRARGDLALDPGVRGGPPGAGGPIPGLTSYERQFFLQGLNDFSEVEDVADGLGPTMNLDSCAGCHMQPAVGGSSPARNPQVAFAAGNDGGTDRVPSFIKANGPVREARFVRNPDGTPDGGVHALFTITGRIGAAGCSISQPDFEAQVASRNVIFRIPTPMFGGGLIEQIPDAAILQNRQSNAPQKRALGIRGRANFRVSGRAISGQSNNNGNDGTISRFGWKAQNVSLLLFSGEAYNVEMGITNELFQVERDQTAGCQITAVPNDTQNFNAHSALEATTAIQNFANFQRFLAPPTPSRDTPGGAESIGRGGALFSSVGCALCHTPVLRTGNTAVAALRNQAANLYSDLLVHDVGAGLADGISQGGAGPREFRTPPLWGLGQRIYFLHDGRTSDLLEAIREHRSSGSEANTVVGNFYSLTGRAQQDLLNFLRSL